MRKMCRSETFAAVFVSIMYLPFCAALCLFHGDLDMDVTSWIFSLYFYMYFFFCNNYPFAEPPTDLAVGCTVIYNNFPLY